MERYSIAQTKQAWKDAHDNKRDYRDQLNAGLSAYGAGSYDGGLSYLRTLARHGGSDSSLLFQSATYATSGLAYERSIGQLQEYKEYAQQYIQDMRNYLDANAQTATADMYETLTQWENVYSNVILRKLDETETEANDKIMAGVQGIITDALNPYRYSDIQDQIPRLTDVLLGEDWTSDRGRRDEAAVREKVESIVNIYRNTLSYAADRIAE